MKKSVAPQPMMAAIGLLVAAVGLTADTLVLRDGRRLQGQLVGVRGGVIEFEENRGLRGSRLVRFDRDEVRSIELEDGIGPSSDDSGRSGARPRGLREREVVVSGDVAWNDAGIDVRAGQVVYFAAVGRVRWGPGRRHGPAGEVSSPYNVGRPIPRRPAAALIGKIGGDSTDYFFIGDDEGPIRMRDTGRLYLGVNDDYLVDNSGSFRVTVFY